MNRFDVVVSGSGVVGAVTALSLAHEGFNVALVETHAPDDGNDDINALRHDPAEFNSRVVALAPASIQVLRQLRQWPLAAGAAAVYRQMEIIAGDSRLEFNNTLIAEPALGWITDLKLLQRSLWRALLDKIHVAAPAEIVSVLPDETELRLQINNGQMWRTRLLIGAEGGRSSLRERAGIHMTERDYQARALVAKIRTEQSNPGIAFQRFDYGGPIALLPLADGRSSMVWTRPEKEAEKLSLLSDEGLAIAVSQACQSRFGRVLSVESRNSFPLRMAIAERIVDQRLVFIGDCAHVVHPLAGLGLNLGILDAVTLAEVIGRAHRLGRDIGSNNTLTRYAARREGDNRLAAYLIDSIERLFGSETNSGFLKFAQRGLAFIDVITPLKYFLARQAAGFAALPAATRRN